MSADANWRAVAEQLTERLGVVQAERDALQKLVGQQIAETGRWRESSLLRDTVALNAKLKHAAMRSLLARVREVVESSINGSGILDMAPAAKDAPNHNHAVAGCFEGGQSCAWCLVYEHILEALEKTAGRGVF